MNQLTEHKLRGKFVTLLYQENPDAFNPGAGLNGQLVGPYRIALQMPTAEFLGKTPVAIAVELMQYTQAAGWREARRRSIAAGDILCTGMSPWLFIEPAHSRLYPMEILQAQDTVVLVQLHPDTVAGMRNDQPKGCDGNCNHEPDDLDRMFGFGSGAPA
jgi:hypothetical protein